MPTPDPGLGHVSRSRNCQRGRCEALLSPRPTLGSSYITDGARPRKSRHRASLHADPLAILLEHTVADTINAAEIFRLLERAVLLAILHDLLGEAAADAAERRQRLGVGGVDVDLLGAGRGRGARRLRR